jgi:hypothetical protein
MADSGNPLDAQRQAVLGVLATLLKPVAQLCIARAVTIQGVEELVRQAFVQAAREACEGTKGDRLTSRISTMTGLTRREVTRLEASPQWELPASRSPATDVLTLWMSLPGYTTKSGRPLVLARLGEEPSFEALASQVTRDVHPRSLMAELVRLQMVEHDLEADTLKLVAQAFVPRADQARMLGFLGTNVGDHLRAAVTNVLGAGSEHFEQALLADEMSDASVHKARKLISDQWRSLMTSLVPQLQALIEDDARQQRPQDRELRIGLYSWSGPMAATDRSSEAPASSQQKGRKTP